MSDNTVNGRPREITAGELRALLAPLENEARIRILVDLPGLVKPKENRYSGKMEESAYVMLTVSPSHPDDPRSRAMMDTKKRKIAHSGEALSLNYSMTLHGREAWDGSLKESECHVTNEEELIALRAGS